MALSALAPPPPVPTLRRSTRLTQQLGKLKDYICNSIWSTKSTSHPSTPLSSLATPRTSLYPLTQYISYSKFTAPHGHFLAVVRSLLLMLLLSPFLSGILRCSRKLPLLQKMHIDVNFSYSQEAGPCNKWVYRIKYKADGFIEYYRAKLIVFRNTQTAGVNFT